MSIYEGFVYEWTNLENGMKYIGSHKGTPDDGYVSSSKYMLNEYNKNPLSFSRKIIAYGKIEEMRQLETELLLLNDAATNSLFYNKHNQNGKFICTSHDDKTKSKMKGRVPWNKGKTKVYSEESLEKMRLAKKEVKPWNVGLSPSVETRKKLSEHKGSNHHFYGKKRPDHAEKMRLAWERRKQNAKI